MLIKYFPDACRRFPERAHTISCFAAASFMVKLVLTHFQITELFKVSCSEPFWFSKDDHPHFMSSIHCTCGVSADRCRNQYFRIWISTFSDVAADRKNYMKKHGIFLPSPFTEKKIGFFWIQNGKNLTQKNLLRGSLSICLYFEVGPSSFQHSNFCAILSFEIMFSNALFPSSLDDSLANFKKAALWLPLKRGIPQRSFSIPGTPHWSRRGALNG